MNNCVAVDASIPHIHSSLHCGSNCEISKILEVITVNVNYSLFPESVGEQANARATVAAVSGPTAVSVSTAANSAASGARECAGCGKRITERYLLKALDLFWHEDCLKCGCCDCRLGEVGSTLYTKANLILCKRDYLRWATPLPARWLAKPIRSNIYKVLVVQHQFPRVDCYKIYSCSVP